MTNIKRSKKAEDTSKTYTLYWLHNPDGTDPYTQFYIGVTSQKLSHRFAKHKFDTVNEPNKKISVWLRDNLATAQIDALAIGTRDEMYALERRYRPHENIGLNSYAGKGGTRASSLKYVRMNTNGSAHLIKYYATIREIRAEYKCGHKDAIALYKEIYGTHQDRRNNMIREFAAQHQMSFSEARRTIQANKGAVV